MAEPAATATTAVGTHDPVPAAQRGRLVVRDRVVERVAHQAARDVDAVTRGRTATWRSLAAPLAGAGDGTRVDVDRTDDRVGLTVHLAVTWPQPLPGTTAATRDAVHDAVTRYAGLEVEHTDVVVDVVPAGPTGETGPAPGDGPALAHDGYGGQAPTARPPVRAPRAAVPAALLALVLIGLGVVGVRDALVTTGLLSGTPWATSAADAVAGATPTVAVLVGGIVATLLGLWFVVAAVRPRPKPYVQVSAASDVWMRPQGVARLARSAAARVAGVAQVTTTASRRTVVVGVTGRTGTAELESPVREAVEAALSGLAHQPRVRVRVKTPAPQPAPSTPSGSPRPPAAVGKRGAQQAPGATGAHGSLGASGEAATAAPSTSPAAAPGSRPTTAPTTTTAPTGSTTKDQS